MLVQLDLVDVNLLRDLLRHYSYDAMLDGNTDENEPEESCREAEAR